MRKILFSFLFMLSFTLQSTIVSVLGASGKKNSFTIDTKKSKIKWTGQKLTENHKGTIKVKQGKIKKKGNSFEGFILIDMNSIACEDIKNPKDNKKLVGHLKSDDFFHVKKYKISKLEITSTKKVSKDKYIISGKITIRGKTEKVSFPAQITFSKKSFKTKGKLTIDRTKFDVRYGSGKFFKSLGDKLIYDDFILDFEVYSK